MTEVAHIAQHLKPQRLHISLSCAVTARGSSCNGAELGPLEPVARIEQVKNGIGNALREQSIGQKRKTVERGKTMRGYSARREKFVDIEMVCSAVRHMLVDHPAEYEVKTGPQVGRRSLTDVAYPLIEYRVRFGKFLGVDIVCYIAKSPFGNYARQ